MEIWKTLKGIVECGDNYEISNLGRVRNSKNKKIRKLKPNHGYLRVALTFNNKQKVYQVHRLVLMTFKPIKNFEIMQVNHIDENPSNNKLENLEWCDASYNVNYGKRNEKISNKMKNEKNPMKRKEVIKKKYKEVAVYNKDGILIGIFESVKYCSEVLNIGSTTISAICNNGGKNKDGYTFIHLRKDC